MIDPGSATLIFLAVAISSAAGLGAAAAVNSIVNDNGKSGGRNRGNKIDTLVPPKVIRLPPPPPPSAHPGLQ